MVAIQIAVFLLVFVALYAILYRPVMRLMEKQPKSPSGGAEAAGGADASVGPLRPGEDTLRRSRSSLLRDRLLISVIIVVFLVDQLSKYAVTAWLSPYESWPDTGVVRIVHGTNTGTAFGLFPDQTSILIVASLLAIGFLFYFYRTRAVPTRLLRLAIGLQLGGAFGNLLDRVKDGAVVDFIDVGWWPVFNLADSSITVGIVVLITVITLSKDTVTEPAEAEGSVPSDT